jgi:hypothetical protein
MPGKAMCSHGERAVFYSTGGHNFILRWGEDFHPRECNDCLRVAANAVKPWVLNEDLPFDELDYGRFLLSFKVIK